jgi:glycosyltransferase involved in cell wall biosynthesis
VPSGLGLLAERIQRRFALSTPRITVGLPVYKGADLIAKCLDCLQRQSFGDFEAIISVDGGDAETAATCQPFLIDPRFRMVVHPERLDWVGNFNWLLQQNLREFFCYRQHDDSTASEFFEVLLRAADKEPNAAAAYCDCQFSGGRDDIEIAPSIEGDPRDRVFHYIEQLSSAAPVRGLIRTAAIRQAGLVRSDEFRAPMEVFVWLVKLLRWGDFRRVAEPLYYRLDHPRSFTNVYFSTSEDRKRAVLTTLFTGLLEATMPLCRTPEERLFFHRLILDRVVASWPGEKPASSEKIITECLERLRVERNTHLFRQEELSPILQELKRRPDLKVVECSRMRKLIYRISQRSRMAKLIYPRSRIQRLSYQIRQLFEILRNKMSRQGAAARKKERTTIQIPNNRLHLVR